MKILLLGANGQVGWELQRSLSTMGNLVACDRAAIDLSDLNALAALIDHHSPDVLVNAAAYTAVDKAESEPDLAMRINAEAVEVMAEKIRERDGLLVHYSTDYVYDGSKVGPYVETDPVNPLSVYGKSKLAGEMAVQNVGCRNLVFRTSWVYATRGKNFIKTMLELSREKTELRVVADQYGAPTSAALIADATALALYRIQLSPRSNLEGTYHLVADGTASWFELACYAIQRALDAGAKFKLSLQNVQPIPTAEYPTPAIRPLNSVMDHSKFENEFGLQLPLWKNHVDRLVDEMAYQGLI